MSHEEIELDDDALELAAGGTITLCTNSSTCKVNTPPIQANVTINITATMIHSSSSY